MPENQPLGVVMDNNQTPVENKIHIQALHQPDPDFFDDSDEIKNILELIEYYLTFNCKNFGDLYLDFEGNGIIIDKIHQIMFDANDDKQGRIKDELNKVIENMAYFVYCNHETNRWARKIYDDTIASVI